MNFQDCIKFASQSRTAYFATVDGNQPRVRPIGLWFVNEQGFYFQTETVKAFYQQLNANKKVEICFHDSEARKAMRVAGEVEFVDDIDLKARVLQDRPFLKGLGIEKPEDPLLVVFRISKGEAFFWTMENNMKESEIDRIKFGSTQ
ncbi:pyridoxamine 5'-phosphate oxidase family protein [Chloroflexota bacterium]